MDIARPDLARKKRLRQRLYGGVAVVAVLLISVAVSRLEPAAPSVDRDTVYLDTVQRGPMVRQVRGTGTLVPEELRWIPSTTDGTVERIVIRPGAEVTPTTTVVELRNPELEQTALEAQLNLRAAEARARSRQVELDSQILAQQSQLATVESELAQATLQAEADQQLATKGLVGSIQLKQSQSRARELATRHELEQERLQIARESIDVQLAAEHAEVDRLTTLWQLRLDQVEDLHVRAGIAGVLQQVPVEEGQRVTAGTNLARVGDPSSLKAELRIAETQAKDIQIGQSAAGSFPVTSCGSTPPSRMAPSPWISRWTASCLAEPDPI